MLCTVEENAVYLRIIFFVRLRTLQSLNFLSITKHELLRLFAVCLGSTTVLNKFLSELSTLQRERDYEYTPNCVYSVDSPMGEYSFEYTLVRECS